MVLAILSIILSILILFIIIVQSYKIHFCFPENLKFRSFVIKIYRGHMPIILIEIILKGSNKEMEIFLV